ncbi:PilZ domain-containing protein [Croceicoccus sp. Ery5]|uniref:PilZ domain-containing protein n=1 Tax=Croceicoccus sp. Ery5 TaxID=1703340 RepID=UPI001E43C5EF|nr:PilZ domain-containing protein [Croceicoccus sp. Ery5]
MSRREHERLNSDRPVECRIDGRHFMAVLYNVSISGCMIEVPLNRVIDGDRVHLKDGNIRMSGVVVWHDERNAGLRFDQPLHEAVVRFLGYDPAKGEPLMPTDRFGRALPRLPRSDRFFSDSR